VRKFKAAHPAFDPPESIKKRREETLRVFKLGEVEADTIRIMTETFFKAGMDRTVELKQMVDNGEMKRSDFDEMIAGLKGGEEDGSDKN
jgi:hypothetical protein